MASGRTSAASLLVSLAAPRLRREGVPVTNTQPDPELQQGWRESTIDVDLYADDEAVFRDIQRLKETQQVNVEFARPEHFVPPLAGVADRHIFIATFGGVSYFHYDPYSQVFSKVVRGFRRDLEDAHRFVDVGLVEAARFREFVDAREAILDAVDAFLDSAGRG